MSQVNEEKQATATAAAPKDVSGQEIQAQSTAPIDVGKIYDSFIGQGGIPGLAVRGYRFAKKHLGNYLSEEKQDKQTEYLTKIFAAASTYQIAAGKGSLAEIDESMKKLRESLPQ